MKMTKTEENLMAAFAGESQANRKYLAYAKKAEKDGYPQIAKTFRAAAAAETVHAHNHLRAVGGIHDTVANIKDAINGEHYEFTSMYPEFLEAAKAEGDKKAEQSFHYANEVEKVHHELYNAALEAAEKEEDLPEKKVYVCPICGYTHEGEPPEKCPVCGAKGSVFEEIE
jgi:rubrerythrin